MLHEQKNFRGQDLRGRAFKNADLQSADFSDTDIRGVNFSGADLTDAKFFQARMGRTLKHTLLILPLKFLIGSVAGYSIPKNNIVFIDWIQASLAAIDIHIAKPSLIHGLRLYIFLMFS